MKALSIVSYVLIAMIAQSSRRMALCSRQFQRGD
jgi:hypothetical protein